MTYELPMNYESMGTHALDWDVTVDDICDFVVDYINSDVLVCLNILREEVASNVWFYLQGLLSDRLLTIAGRFCKLISIIHNPYDPV